MKPRLRYTIGPSFLGRGGGPPRRPDGRGVVRLSVSRGVRWLTARGATKKGPREAPADRVERSTCASRGSLAAREHGATSGPALTAGGERRACKSAQRGGLLCVGSAKKNAHDEEIRPGRPTHQGTRRASGRQPSGHNAFLWVTTENLSRSPASGGCRRRRRRW